MIRYDRLWATMEARGMTQYRLIKQYSFSAGQIGRLKKNMHVSTHTLDTLCSILECDISDIIEYVPDELPQPEEVPAGQSADTPEIVIRQRVPVRKGIMAREKIPARRTRLRPSRKGPIRPRATSLKRPRTTNPKKQASPKRAKRVIKNHPKTGKREKTARKTNKHSAISAGGPRIFTLFRPPVVYFPPF